MRRHTIVGVEMACSVLVGGGGASYPHKRHTYASIIIKARKRIKHGVLYHTTVFLHSAPHVTHFCMHLGQVFNRLPATGKLQAAATGMLQAGM